MLQDFKLNVVRWHLLPGLGKLLFSMAHLLSAPDYKEHYRRDLGSAALQVSNQGDSSVGSCCASGGQTKYKRPLWLRCCCCDVMFVTW